MSTGDFPLRNAKLPVTVLIPTRNEEKNLRDCLRSVQWADEVFVVDSRSTDGTAAIAEEFGAKVVQFDYHGGWPKKKNWAIQNLPIRNEWILLLDADERITTELAIEIGSALRHPVHQGYYVRWKFVFLGQWLRHCWNDGWMLRLFRLGKGSYEDLGMRAEGGWDNEVHENLLVNGSVGKLHNHLLHDSRQDLAYWIRKQNEFSTWNAARQPMIFHGGLPELRSIWSSDPLLRRKFLRAIYIRLPCKPLIFFLFRYFWKCGFLDGKAGLYFCLLMATHELHTAAKVYEAAIASRNQI